MFVPGQKIQTSTCKHIIIKHGIIILTGLGGSTPLEDLMIDQVAYGCDDLMRKIEPFMWIKDEKIMVGYYFVYNVNHYPSVLSGISE